MSGFIDEFSVGALPRGLCVGPDGYIRFVEAGASKIARISTNFTGYTEYSVPTGSEGIAVGPDGNIWFTEYGRNSVAKFLL